MSDLDNDYQKMFALADEFDRLGRFFDTNMTNVEKALGHVMQRCEDARISEFNAEFRRTSVLLQDFRHYLGLSSERLRGKAEVLQNAIDY